MDKLDCYKVVVRTPQGDLISAWDFETKYEVGVPVGWLENAPDGYGWEWCLWAVNKPLDEVENMFSHSQLLLPGDVANYSHWEWVIISCIAEGEITDMLTDGLHCKCLTMTGVARELGRLTNRELRPEQIDNIVDDYNENLSPEDNSYVVDWHMYNEPEPVI